MLNSSLERQPPWPTIVFQFTLTVFSFVSIRSLNEPLFSFSPLPLHPSILPQPAATEDSAPMLYWLLVKSGPEGASYGASFDFMRHLQSHSSRMTGNELVKRETTKWSVPICRTDELFAVRFDFVTYNELIDRCVHVTFSLTVISSECDTFSSLIVFSWCSMKCVNDAIRSHSVIAYLILRMIAQRWKKKKISEWQRSYVKEDEKAQQGIAKIGVKDDTPRERHAGSYSRVTGIRYNFPRQLRSLRIATNWAGGSEP